MLLEPIPSWILALMYFFFGLLIFNYNYLHRSRGWGSSGFLLHLLCEHLLHEPSKKMFNRLSRYKRSPVDGTVWYTWRNNRPPRQPVRRGLQKSQTLVCTAVKYMQWFTIDLIISDVFIACCHFCWNLHFSFQKKEMWTACCTTPETCGSKRSISQGSEGETVSSCVIIQWFWVGVKFPGVS